MDEDSVLERVAGAPELEKGELAVLYFPFTQTTLVQKSVKRSGVRRRERALDSLRKC
jgi:hypothetical protein